MLPQPDDVTCGPTCLHAVYRYWGHELPLSRVIDEIPPLPEGGTLAVDLGCHALRQGFSAQIYTYNLQLFDPSWFRADVDLAERLQLQRRSKRDQKLSIATDAYLDFLELGGEVKYEELSSSLVRRFIRRGLPVLTGLSATYLYGCEREADGEYDDVQGHPTGHFVVVCGDDRESRKVMVADPLHENPSYDSHYYSVDTTRLIASILLGVITYDANLLIIAPQAAPNESN